MLLQSYVCKLFKKYTVTTQHPYRKLLVNKV